MGVQPVTSPRAAVLRAYHLVEEVQADRMLEARAEIAEGIASAEPGSELRRTLLYADAVDSVVNRPERAPDAAKALVKACEVDGDHALHAAALGIRAETEVRSGDITAALHDTARATILLERPGDPLARVSGMISVAETYGTLSLWELGDEMYDMAESLMPDCDDRLLEPVTQINRAVTRFWWAAALLEVGQSPTEVGLDRAIEPRVDVIDLPMPDVWRRMLVASLSARGVLLGLGDEDDIEALAAQQPFLIGHEVRLQVHLALAHSALRAGRWTAAQREIDAAMTSLDESLTPHRRSLLAWTAALVHRHEQTLTGSPTARYATLVAAQRWDERLSRLAAARTQVTAERLGRDHAVLVRQSLEDHLTGLGNRRALDDCLDHLADTLAPDADVAMVVLDVDHFKGINDLHGHVAGDRVLARVAAVLANSLRPGDVAVRLGGDEFCAVLVGAPRSIVEERAERIRQLLTEQEWGSVASGLTVGVSVGAATGVGPGDLATLYVRADAALYAAKQAGRNRLRLAI